MRTARGALLVAVWVVGAMAGLSMRAHAEQVKAPCQRAAANLGVLVGAKAQSVVARRCERDRWSKDARTCFEQAPTSRDAQRCIDKLSKEQRTALEGDADRLGDKKLQIWLARRPLIATTSTVLPASALPPPGIMLAGLAVAGSDAGRARALHTEGLSAYQAGRYEFAIRKFAAALEANPTPELVYHSAQAYRLKGDRARALEHYERYLELSPDGPAANACRAQIERLRDAPQ